MGRYLNLGNLKLQLHKLLGHRWRDSTTKLEKKYGATSRTCVYGDKIEFTNPVLATPTHLTSKEKE